MIPSKLEICDTVQKDVNKELDLIHEYLHLNDKITPGEFEELSKRLNELSEKIDSAELLLNDERAELDNFIAKRGKWAIFDYYDNFWLVEKGHDDTEISGFGTESIYARAYDSEEEARAELDRISENQVKDGILPSLEVIKLDF